MIEFEKVSFGFPDKDLYYRISFEIESGEHAVLIGSNGCGKSTLAQLIMHEERYTYEGRIVRPDGIRIGYVPQFIPHEAQDTTVYDFLAAPLLALLERADAAAAKMADAEDMDAALSEYQSASDDISSADAYNYDANIRQELALSGLTHTADLPVRAVSGGEYKLLCIIRSMLVKPPLLILDEPDVFLDFDNIIGLSRLINNYDGTLLSITHSRLLLSLCFDKILHIENMELQQFPGSFAEYSRWLLETKIELFEAAKEFDDYIRAQKRLLKRLQKSAELTTDPKLGKRIQARKKLIERMKTIRGSDPFLDGREYDFSFSSAETGSADSEDPTPVIAVKDFNAVFGDRTVLRGASFELCPGQKAAIVGANGTGKTTLLRHICDELTKSMPDGSVGYFGQIIETGEDPMSGGERSMAELAALRSRPRSVLLLDEPTSHLDVYAQRALEKALREFSGTVLLVSHDFFTVTSCADRIFIIENGTLRETSGRAYRKSIYQNYFTSDVLEAERRRIDTELRINNLIRAGKFDEARALLDELPIPPTGVQS